MMEKSGLCSAESDKASRKKRKTEIERLCLVQDNSFLSFQFAVLVVMSLRKQVAQLWQRDRAKLGTFSINIQRYLQNHTKMGFFGPNDGGIKGNICALSKIFNRKKPYSRGSSREYQLYS